MIINEKNKDTILRGKFKRGFNQTPEELKEKLHDDLSNYRLGLKPKTEIKVSKIGPNNINRTIENLRK